MKMQIRVKSPCSGIIPTSAIVLFSDGDYVFLERPQMIDTIKMVAHCALLDKRIAILSRFSLPDTPIYGRFGWKG
jgi:hypothetical protein